eukprot:TRINITY_DN16860_c0_g1_i1.p3 TRINITY_DN16860_c0_g1~~TRINITY_DN16860_c0_g1_i1.p3  ORF type:complete len:127 (-),score=12.95 TRINITY_DN16860_c0_g1_i1:83-463(-)
MDGNQRQISTAAIILLYQEFPYSSNCIFKQFANQTTKSYSLPTTTLLLSYQFSYGKIKQHSANSPLLLYFKGQSSISVHIYYNYQASQLNVIWDFIDFFLSSDNFLLTCLLYTSDAADEEDSLDFG